MGNLSSGRMQLTISECRIYDRPRLIKLEIVRFDQFFELSLAIRGNVRMSRLINRARQRDRLDEVLNQVAFTANSRATPRRNTQDSMDNFLPHQRPPPCTRPNQFTVNKT